MRVLDSVALGGRTVKADRAAHSSIGRCSVPISERCGFAHRPVHDSARYAVSVTDPPSWAVSSVPPRRTSWVATRKVTAGTVTAGVVAMTVWMLDSLAITIPAPLAAVLTGLLTAGIAYLIPEASIGPAGRPGRHEAPPGQVGGTSGRLYSARRKAP